MNSILLYIVPEEDERQSMVQQAADFVEALTFKFDEQMSIQSIGVIAEPSVCLEIGLTMLGRGEARTVEGGKRRTSPLMVFPFLSEDNQESAEIQLLYEGGSYGDSFGTLNDLVSLGAIELDREYSINQVSPYEVLERVLRLRSWQGLVIMSSDSAYERIDPELQTNARIVNMRNLEVREERVSDLMERLEPIEGEMAIGIRKQAVIQALQLEALFFSVWDIG